MTPPLPTYARWLAQVEADLGGKPFDRTLVHRASAGLSIQPLYTEAPTAPPLPGEAPYVRGSSGRPGPFGVCMRHDSVDLGAMAEDLEGGADALWLTSDGELDLERVFSTAPPGRCALVLRSSAAPATLLDAVKAASTPGAGDRTELRIVFGIDPTDELARGCIGPGDWAGRMAQVATSAAGAASLGPAVHGALVSTLTYHGAGADAVDELACALSAGAACFEALLDAGLTPDDAARSIAVQVAVGRDTFVEIAKLRALRVCWYKLCAALGAPRSPLALLHGVTSSRTLTRRDPWGNQLRLTTQLFAAALGGADLITPVPYDQALGVSSQQGRRLCRNAALVLRDESHLGAVTDPAGGAYFFETVTDQLARAAWDRFRELERDGGVVVQLGDGRLRRRLEAAWSQRRESTATRRDAIIGVSEFIAVQEDARRPTGRPVAAPSLSGLPQHRDAEEFEALQEYAEAVVPRTKPPHVWLIPLGPIGDHRARLAYSQSLLGLVGLSLGEGRPNDVPVGAIACLCGTDEAYAAQAHDAARQLRVVGARRVLLAGRPGALEASLREAGVTDFIFLGCDVVKALRGVLGDLS